jgi:transposase
MAKHHKLELTGTEIQALVELRDKGEPAYLRERATALLKIHQGSSPHEVARKGLLKPRDPDTVYAWLRRYREHGILGLSNKPGRGRKPAFSPKSPEEAESELLEAIGQDPGLVNPQQTRWTLRTLGQVVPWLRDVCVSGVHQILSRLGISYKRARDYVRSPDVDYAEKLSRIQQALEEVSRENPETCVVVYQDEFGFTLQPTVAKDWAETGTKDPLARQSHRSQETCYGIGALNPHTGDVVYQQVKSCTVVALHTFYTHICHRYPKAERIYLIQDNRAIHFHANLMAVLLPQMPAFAKPTPPEWTGKLSKKIGTLAKLRIEIVQLPTYASWTNPIEKLWRWVRQSVIHLHRLSEDWQALQDEVLAFMEQFKGGSQPLLCYVGLLPN